MYFDNFFSSVDLLMDLRRNGLYSCGTLRSNRKGFPATLKPLMKKGFKTRGDSKTCQSEDLTVALWQDSKPVLVIATNSDPLTSTTVERKAKDGTKNIIPCPQSIHLYNRFMGGVDKNDQLRNYYNVRLKSRKFYKYLFWFVFDVAITNAYILCTKHTSLTTCSVEKFRSDLARDLIGDFCNRKRRGRPSSDQVQKRFCEDHFPMKSQQRLRCHLCYHKKKERHETMWQCPTCKLPFCHNGHEDDCFLLYHKSLK